MLIRKYFPNILRIKKRGYAMVYVGCFHFVKKKISNSDCLHKMHNTEIGDGSCT